MSVKPILFNTEMVRAILDGRKTQTRRIIKTAALGMTYEDGSPARKPPYKTGDVLWARETWNYGYIETSDAEGRSHESWFEELREPAHGYLGALARYFYRADTDDERAMAEIAGKWHPSIHMPREAARLFLRVKEVRVERLHDMSAVDCVADGGFAPEAIDAVGIAPLFGPLWNGTIKKTDLPCYGWDANPWVWVIEFERRRDAE